jgi:hypothetical protein
MPAGRGAAHLHLQHDVALAFVFEPILADQDGTGAAPSPPHQPRACFEHDTGIKRCSTLLELSGEGLQASAQRRARTATGLLLQVIGKARRQDRVVAIETQANNLRSLKALYIDCGEKDQFNLLYGARRFVRRLSELGIAHRYEEFPDNHTGVDYRMDESLPFLAQALSG